MKSKTLQSNILLLLAAIIWGFAFVAQRVGAQYISPFTFNAVRFALGSFALVPLIILFDKKAKRNQPHENYDAENNIKALLKSGCIMGTVLFIAATFQQIGIFYTTAGKTAFITGLYIVLVPFIGVFLKHHIHKFTWLGALLATVGLFLLTMVETLSISFGDLLVLIGAFFFAVHILCIDYFSKILNVIKLSCIQFSTCSILSFVAALALETFSIEALSQGVLAILYSGLFSVGIAYTLQVVGQQHAQPAHAAIILSLEVVFGFIGGWLILHERLGVQGIIGGMLMLAGMLTTQIPIMRKTTESENIKT